MTGKIIIFAALILLVASWPAQDKKGVEMAEGVKEIILKTEDGTKIALNEFCQQREKVVIICHGIVQYKDGPLIKGIAAEFEGDYDVLNMDLRGHGRSGGRCTLSALEIQDLKVVVNYARKNHKKVGVIGFSLGAATAILEAAKYKDIDSLILVSPFARVREVDMKFWRKEAFVSLRENIKDGKKGVKMGNPLLPKQAPIEVIADISPIPVLFIHGTNDWTIDINHSERLYEKAVQPKEFVRFEKAKHAEYIYQDFPEEFIQACKSWLAKTL